jgi:hypothetical protein
VNQDSRVPFANSTAASSVQDSASTEPGPSKDKELLEPTDRRGPFNWIKAKMTQNKEERREREAEKERAKSPPRSETEHSTSKHSLSALSSDLLPRRGRSMEVKRETNGENADSTAVTEPTPTTADATASGS